MPAVSVVVAVRDGEQHLRQTLESICSQTLADLEIIVVDDGSTDSTPQIIAEFVAADGRVRTLPGPAIGSAGAARNAGLSVAGGKYLAFLDADDFFAPELLRRLYERAERDHADVVATGFRVFDEFGGEPVGVDWGLRIAHLPTRRPFPPEALGASLFYAFGPVAWNKLFRADFVARHGLQFQSLRRTNDLLFTFSALALAERVSYIDRMLIDYRIGNAGSLQGSRHLGPLDFAEALGALQEVLRSEGLYERFEPAFVNEAAEVCLTNLERASTFAAFQQIDQALRTDLLERFGLLGRSPDYFVARGLGERLAAYLDSTPEQYLFARSVRLSEQVRNARAELRTALREVAARPASPLPSAPTVPALAEPAPVRDRSSSGAGVDVSVIVPVYNTAPWLSDCLRGVQRQTGVSVEVICVDDGSTDSSPEILQRLAASDPRIRVVTQANGGLSVARNTGMAEASGRYLCFLDSDDYWGPDALAALVGEADRIDADMLLFDADILAEPGVDEKTRRTYHESYYRRSHDAADVLEGPALMARMKAAGDYRVQACLYLLRSDYVRERGLSFRPGLPREDNLFTFEAMLKARRAGHRAVPLYVRRLRPGSLITAGTRASAARGYYVSFYEMLRITAGMSFDDEIGVEVGATAFKAFKAAAEHFERLDPDVGDRLAQVDSQPDAQAAFLILKRSREQARRARRQGTPPAPATTLSAPARLRRLGGRGYRYLLRLLRRP